VKLRGATFLTDENIHPDIVEFLRGVGCEMLDVKGARLYGGEDVLLIRRSHAEQRIILTHDSDFGTHAISGSEPTVGTVYLRPGHILPEFTIGTIRASFDQELNLIPPFFVVARRSGHRMGIRAAHLK